MEYFLFIAELNEMTNWKLQKCLSKFVKVVVMNKFFKAEQFHNRYIQLYEHIVVVTLIDGTTLEGLYNDDFYEDEAILIGLIGSPNVAIVKIDDIQKMELSPLD